MKALKDFIEDYTTPTSCELSRDLNDKLKPQITFLKECRPNSISMGNAIRSLKSRIQAVPTGVSETETKDPSGPLQSRVEAQRESGLH